MDIHPSKRVLNHAQTAGDARKPKDNKWIICKGHELKNTLVGSCNYSDYEMLWTLSSFPPFLVLGFGGAGGGEPHLPTTKTRASKPKPPRHLRVT